MKATVYVTLKAGIHDPQGEAIRQSLSTLGFDSIQGVRVGKYLEIEISETDPSTTEATVKQICEKLLANTVIEDFRFELRAS
ncbi:MAG: phosphoribosylformylglycinamidine synthase subunit PurS [Nitrospirales bacterium]|nr:phosphoribosylformylglycinamidine synthase subunit PurS [Nitrospirales bacterium]